MSAERAFSLVFGLMETTNEPVSIKGKDAPVKSKSKKVKLSP
jgi:hypothetical protein